MKAWTADGWCQSFWAVPVSFFLYCLVKYKKKVFGPWQTKRNTFDLLVYGLLGISCC
jgi:hypothetical protein